MDFAEGLYSSSASSGQRGRRRHGGVAQAHAALESAAEAASAGGQTDLIAKVLALVREERIDFFGIGGMSAAYQTMETALGAARFLRRPGFRG